MKPLKIESFIKADHYKALEPDDAKFILEHGEKQLKDTIDGSGLIVSRLTTLVSITVAMMVGLTGYAVSRGITNGFKDPYAITSILGVIYLYIPAILIVWNFLSKKYYHLGSEPKDFFDNKIFVENKGEEIKSIYCYEILNVQARIVANKVKNNWRWLLFNITLMLILLSPIILYLIFTFITPRIVP